MSVNHNILLHQLYNEYSKMVYNLSLQYVQNSEDAADITQEVFIKVYQHLHKFDSSNASYKTWIYRITINQSLDFIKQKKAKKRFGFITSIFHSDTNEPINDIAHFNHPGVQLEDKEMLQKVFTFLNELPEKQRTAVILAKLDDKSQKEIADIMQLSVKAVESLLQRAKQNLIKKMNSTEG